MGFSGRPSKGCLPCRQKRTKCDLAQPSCTQCVRKNRKCEGYRNEQDMRFRDETNVVVRKARRRTEEPQPGPSSSANVFALQVSAVPSRRAAIDDEAVSHFFAHYNEKLFASESHISEGGFDYILPVYQQDSMTGGPIPEIVRAAGLAALGNTRGSQELRDLARLKYSIVINQLSKQLADPNLVHSDSSILTCIMLGVFENIICDAPHNTQAMTYHLHGAAQLAKQRGAKQFQDDVGYGIYVRMRGFLLAHRLQTREPLPDFVLEHLEDQDNGQRDFSPQFTKLLARLCQLRHDHKVKGHVDADMARSAKVLLEEFVAWQPDIPEWVPGERPEPSPEAMSYDNGTHRFVWLATIWIFKQSALILTEDLVIEWARDHLLRTPGSPAASTLDEAVSHQIMLCDELKDSTEYYLENFASSQSAMRTVGGYGLLWPLYVLSTSSTCTPDTMVWIAKQAEKVADEFCIRQGKTMADVMWMFVRSSSTYNATSTSPA